MLALADTSNSRRARASKLWPPFPASGSSRWSTARPRIRRPRAADRRSSDHLAAAHGGHDDRGARTRSRPTASSMWAPVRLPGCRALAPRTRVISVERIDDLRVRAHSHLHELDMPMSQLSLPPMTLGRPEDAPYDAHHRRRRRPARAALAHRSAAPGGRLIIPVGDLNTQELVRARRIPCTDSRSNGSVHVRSCRWSAPAPGTEITRACFEKVKLR